MFNIIIATHGQLATEFLTVLHSFFGELTKMTALNLSDQGINQFEKEVKAKTAALINQDTIAFCDLAGGTPFNELAKLYPNWQVKFTLIGGVSLPVLVETLNLRMQNQSLGQVISQIKPAAQLVFYKPQTKLNDDDE